jgi:Type I phosphodiesterase / nucleotide pyrophosphatase
MTTLLQAAPAARKAVTDHSVILLEFNELSPTLIARFMGAGELPSFQRMYRESQVYVTDAGEAAPNLEPWIQWVTVHSGLSFGEHGVFNLGDGHKLNQKRVWDIISDHGLKVWICGSMNLAYELPLNGCVLPDAWTTGCKPYPEELAPFYDFVASQVQEHTNERAAPKRSDLLRFLRFMFSRGLSPRTVIAIAKQLFKERSTGKGRWKRATILDRLQWDVFRWYYRKIKPNFSTFFINSTAHFQHMHWRNMDPTPFQAKPSDAEQAEYERAILFGYKQMDKIVGDALALSDENTTLILASALSQQPCVLYEESGGKVNYRTRDLKAVLEFAGITEPLRVAPVMSEQFNVHFNSEADAVRATERLLSLRIDGRPAMLARRNGDTVFTGCRIHDRLADDVALVDSSSNQSVPFFQLFYRVEGVKSGMHHPDGILWLRNPGAGPRVQAAKVPLLDVAPTLLALLGIPKPAYMRGSPLE